MVWATHGLVLHPFQLLMMNMKGTTVKGTTGFFLRYFVDLGCDSSGKSCEGNDSDKLLPHDQRPEQRADLRTPAVGTETSRDSFWFAGLRSVAKM